MRSAKPTAALLAASVILAPIPAAANTRPSVPATIAPRAPTLEVAGAAAAAANTVTPVHGQRASRPVRKRHSLLGGSLFLLLGSLFPGVNLLASDSYRSGGSA